MTNGERGVVKYIKCVYNYWWFLFIIHMLILTDKVAEHVGRFEDSNEIFRGYGDQYCEVESIK